MNHPDCLKIGIVVSRFHISITEILLAEATQYFKAQYPAQQDAVNTVWVPGAVEIPLVTQVLAQTSQYSAIIGLGAVIRGETDHYDYVCQQVSYGCQKIALTFNLPIVFGILTTHTLEQAKVRANGEHSNKGREAMQTALTMVSTLKQLNT